MRLSLCLLVTHCQTEPGNVLIVSNTNDKGFGLAIVHAYGCDMQTDLYVFVVRREALASVAVSDEDWVVVICLLWLILNIRHALLCGKFGAPLSCRIWARN